MKHVIIMVMKRYFMLVFILCMLSSIVFADNSLKRTVDEIEQALLEKDIEVLNQHISLNSIISSKIKYMLSKVRSKKSIMAKSLGGLGGLSEPMLTKAVSKLTLSEFSKSSLELRKSYLSQLYVSKIDNRDQIGLVSGSFMGKPFSAAFVKNNDIWVLVSIQSTLVDHELQAALSSMTGVNL